ncbi:MAG: hypothetical protein V1770_05525 [bacterium]
MTLTLGTYTTTMPADVLPGDLSFPFGISLELENTSSANIWSFWRIKYPRPALPAYPETYREGFIGILTDDEAREMREKLGLFKKRFNDDFAKKHQILFGH